MNYTMGSMDGLTTGKKRITVPPPGPGPGPCPLAPGLKMKEKCRKALAIFRVFRSRVGIFQELDEGMITLYKMT